MSIPPSDSSVILSPTEPLHSKGSDSRFPFATAYAGFTVVMLGLLILPALMLNAIIDSQARRIAELVIILPIGYFVFRWAINKHILGNVALATSALADYGKRLHFKNPFLAGFIAYLALNMLISTVVDPIQELVALDSVPANFIPNLLISIVVGYFAFTLAVKRVVLKPYSAKRLWPMLGLIFVFSISITFALALVQARQEWAFRNHIYCEVLRPGMTQSEVTTALKEYGARGQFDGEYGFKVPGSVKSLSFTAPYFDDSEMEYRLNLILGYDSNGALVAVGRRNIDLANYRISASAIECPLPFR